MNENTSNIDIEVIQSVCTTVLSIRNDHSSYGGFRS